MSEQADTKLTSHEARNSGYRAVFAYPSFRKLWIASLFSMAGAAVAQVALPLLVYDVTGSASLMSLVFSAQFATEAIIAPLSGVMADTFDRKTLLVSATVLRTIFVAFLPFVESAWQIALIGVFVSAGRAIFIPADQASIPNTVPSEDLVTAISSIQVLGTLMRVIGPGIGAAIIGLSGPRPAFVLQAACFSLAAIVLTRLELPPPAHRYRFSGGRDFSRYAFGQFRVGLATVVRTPIVRGLCVTEALWAFVMAVFSITFVVLTEETLDLGGSADTIYALLFGSVSAGAVIGAIVARRVERTLGLNVLLGVGYLGPLFLVPIGLTPPLPVIFACAVALGFTDAWAVIAIFSFLARSVSDELRGRVFAIWGGAISASALVAFAITGWLTDRYGPPATLILLGLFVGLGGPLSLVATGALADVRGTTNRTQRAPV